MARLKKEAAPVLNQSSQRANPANLYEHDYYTWTGTQAQALRERKVSELDWENLAEEVEDLGKAERHRLESHLQVAIDASPQMAYQPQRRSRSWSKSIREHRFRILRVLRDNPGLKPKLPEIFADAYEAARFSAENETGLGLTAFAESCPWSVDDAMRNDFWPGRPPKENEQRRAKRSSGNQ